MALRYCDIPFPSYRFIPGRNPHPTADPRGHSYQAPGSPSRSICWVSPADWAQSIDYLYGCDLYNHAYWWEAHEAWEGLWQLTDKGGIQGRFLKGLIQASACHLKRFLGQVNGVERLRRTSLSYLHAVVDRVDGKPYMGLDLVAFVSRLEAYHDTCAARKETGNRHDQPNYPYLLLGGRTPRESAPRS